jgi:Ca2+-binding EF-hand superfamily protein
MSVSNISGGAGSGGLSQMLAAMLSRLSKAQAEKTQAPATSASGASDTTQTKADNSLTGTGLSTLSDQVLGALVMMQGQQGAASDANSSNQGSDPLQQAFSQLDSDGDGSISKSELETVVKSTGGTADEADTIYSAIGGTDTAGISQSQFGDALKAGGPPPGGPPPGGPPPGSPPDGAGPGKARSANDDSGSSTAVFNALDTNKDGTVSAAELTAGLEGSAQSSDASTTKTDTTKSSDTFASIDTNGDGGVSQDELSSFLKSTAQQVQSDQDTLSAFMTGANRSYNTSLGLMSTDQSGQAAYA